MARRVDRLADGGDAAGDAGRGLVVHDRDGLDGVAAIVGELRVERLGIDAVAPVAGDEIDLQAPRVGHLRHSVAKWPVSNMSTLSPGESVLTSAASHAPVPEAG